MACHAGHLEIVQLLLDSRADLSSTRRPLGTTPLHLAAQEGHVELCRLLLSRRCAPNGLRELDEATPLIFAAARGHLKATALPEKGRTCMKMH